jgi:arylsulfatase A-like enzyme
MRIIKLERVRQAVVILGVALALGGILSGRGTHGPPPREHDRRLAPRMRIEEAVVNLVATFDRSAVAGETAEAPVRVGRLEPSRAPGVNAPHRRAIIAPPPARIRFAVHVPDDAVLRFGTGVEARRNAGSHAASDSRSDAGSNARPETGRDAGPDVGAILFGPDGGTVRFTVHVDGDQVFARDIAPPSSPEERRWFDAAVDLAAFAGKGVEIELATRVAGTHARPFGVPGWSHVRIVRESSATRQAATPESPNVLVLLVDTLRADRLGCYGATPSPSPALDRLAAGGLVFEEFISQAPWTLPSVATFFTGLHPRSHGVIGQPREAAEPEGADNFYLADTLDTVATLAQARGITTVGVSGSPLVSRGTNLARGFESFVEFGWDHAVARWPRAKRINRVFLDWLRANRDYRFLAYLHYMDVHEPYEPPRGYRPPAPDGVRPDVARGRVQRILEARAAGESDLSAAELSHLRALYDAQIRYWDSELERLLEALATLGVRERTVVLVTSDHGEAFLEHDHLGHGAQLYDELVRVPLVVAGPPVPSGRVAAQAQGIDLLPTIGGLLGIDVPAGLPGQNLRARVESRPAVSEVAWGGGPGAEPSQSVAVRAQSWKLVHDPAAGHFELYDLESDPAERENRYGRAPQGAALADYLTKWTADAPKPPPVTGADPEIRERLRALGYME